MKKKQMSFTCCCNFSLTGCKGVEQEHPSKHPAPLIKSILMLTPSYIRIKEKVNMLF